MNQNTYRLFTAAAAFALLVASCGTQDTDSVSSQPETSVTRPDRTDKTIQETQENTAPAQAETPSVSRDPSSLFTDRDLRGTYNTPDAVITCIGDSVSIEGSGAAVNGSDITITEEGVYRITGTLYDGQILVNSPGKIQLVMDNASLSCSDSAPIYVQQAKKCFLTLAEGTENSVSDSSDYLYAEEGANEPDAAIFSADSLTINGSGSLQVFGNYNEGISCKDDLVITDGTLNITSVGNGIKDKDYVAIAGGDITITAGADGIKSDNTEDAACGFVYVQDGSITVSAQEDCIQAETDFIAEGGSFHLTAGDDGIHAEQLVDITGGTVLIPASNEGIEAAKIRISGGTVDITASDDGINASDDTPQGAMGTYSGGAALEISGGNVSVNAGGDGLDSNGDLCISGGTVIVDGPTNNGNGALDGNGSISCTGGVLIAVGSSGMAEYPEGSQNTVVITLDSPQAGGTAVQICDESGTEQLSHFPAKQFDSIVISSPMLLDGETYLVYTNGTEIGRFTVESSLTFVGNAAGMMGGRFPGDGMDGGFPGGRGSHDRQDGEIPTDENGGPLHPEGRVPGGGFPGAMPPDMQVS